MLSSSGEKKIHNALAARWVPFAEEYEFPDLVSTSGRHLRFDFAVFRGDGSLDFLIEFQGRQHYQPVEFFGGARGAQRQRYNDQRKRGYCVKNGIRLVSIPFWDEDKITYEYIMRAAGHNICES